MMPPCLHVWSLVRRTTVLRRTTDETATFPTGWPWCLLAEQIELRCRECGASERVELAA